MASRTESMLHWLPTILVEERIEALVIDTYQFYVELVPMHLGIPYIHLSNALPFDYSGCTPLCLYGWPHETTSAALARNQTGVAKFAGMLTEANARVRSCATSLGLRIDWENPALAQGVPQIAIPVTHDQPGVAARIADKKTGSVTSLDKLTESHLSALLDGVLNDSTYRSNARKLQQAIVETNGLARAADLVEQGFGLTRSSQKQ